MCGYGLAYNDREYILIKLLKSKHISRNIGWMFNIKEILILG